jgi:hypothetical protein
VDEQALTFIPSGPLIANPGAFWYPRSVIFPLTRPAPYRSRLGQHISDHPTPFLTVADRRLVGSRHHLRLYSYTYISHLYHRRPILSSFHPLWSTSVLLLSNLQWLSPLLPPTLPAPSPMLLPSSLAPWLALILPARWLSSNLSWKLI